MSDILIKNMDMPKGDEVLSLTIYPDGRVCLYMKEVATAVALPEHGELIDRQAVLSYFETAFLMGADMDYEDIVGIVSNPKAIPTIVEATE